jgi:hypothetical protein
MLGRFSRGTENCLVADRKVNKTDHINVLSQCSILAAHAMHHGVKGWCLLDVAWVLSSSRDW